MFIRVRWIQEQVQREKVVFTRIDTDDNVADLFTKALPADKFEKFKSKLIG